MFIVADSNSIQNLYCKNCLTCLYNKEYRIQVGRLCLGKKTETETAERGDSVLGSTRLDFDFFVP